MAAFCAPAGWDHHACGHAVFAHEAAKRVPDGHDESSRAARRRVIEADDPELLVAMKRAGQQHAMFLFTGASPTQRAAMVHSTDRSGSSALHWAAEFGFAELVAALLAAGADPQAVNAAGLTPLEYAAKESHVACTDALAQAAPLPGGRPRATAALRGVALAPWRILSAAATPLVREERHSAAALLVFALRRLMQPHASPARGGLSAPYFEAGRPLLTRLAALDEAAVAGAAPCFRVDEAEVPDAICTVALSLNALNNEAKQAVDAAAVVIALAGGLSAAEQAPFASLRVCGLPLPLRLLRSNIRRQELTAFWPNQDAGTLRIILRTCSAVNALTECAMATLGKALAAPAAPRHVTLQLAIPFPWRFEGVSPTPSAAEIAAVARLPSMVAAAFSHALRTGWAQDGTLRCLTLELPPGMRLCAQQRLLLLTRALAAPHSAVLTVLMGACHPRSRSPLRLLSTELLRRVLNDCIFAVRIVELDAPPQQGA